MNKTTAVLLQLILFFIGKAHAQVYIGIKGGVSDNYLITGNNIEAFTVYRGSAGFSLGVPVVVPVNDWLELSAAPGLIQKSYRIVRTGFFGGVYQKNRNDYLQLPLYAGISVGSKRLRGFVKLGVYAAYWLSGRVKGTEANILNTADTTTLNPSGILNVDNAYTYDERYHFNSITDNRWELGVSCGAGMSFQFHPAYRLFVEASYLDALTDQQKKYQINQIPGYNSTYAVEAGCLFRVFPVTHSKKRPVL